MEILQQSKQSTCENLLLLEAGFDFLQFAKKKKSTDALL
jgi:hypothetical protein